MLTNPFTGQVTNSWTDAARAVSALVRRQIKVSGRPSVAKPSTRKLIRAFQALKRVDLKNKIPRSTSLAKTKEGIERFGKVGFRKSFIDSL